MGGRPELPTCPGVVLPGAEGDREALALLWIFNKLYIVCLVN